MFPLLVVLVLGCKSRPNGEGAKYYDNADPVLQASIDAWRKDPLGCKDQRDVDMAQRIAEGLQPLMPTERALVSLLGPAEIQKPSADKHYVAYYFDTDCEGSKLKAGSVYCLLEFYFAAATGAWVSVSVICG